MLEHIIYGPNILKMEKISQEDWKVVDEKLYKKFIFSDFQEAFAFMLKVAFVAEKNNHHPRWTNEYNTLEFWLSTHDKGDIVTEKDHKLAEEIDKLR